MGKENKTKKVKPTKEVKTHYQISKTTYRPSSVFKDLLAIDEVVTSEVDSDIFHEILDLHIFHAFNVQGKLEGKDIKGIKAEIIKHIEEDYDNTFTFEGGLSFSILIY